MSNNQKRNNKMQFLEQAEKSDLIDVIGIIREDWDRVDFLESYQDEWESVPKKTKDCKEQMAEYLHNTYDKSLLQDIIMDYRLDENTMIRISSIIDKAEGE